MTPPSPTGGASRSGLSGLELTVLILFFLSGASALVYEVVWTRSLTNVFGGSAFAIATVLAAFMAGLALGSTVFGRAIDRRGHPLLVYGFLELGIALWALILPLLFGALDHLYAGIYRSMDPGFTTLSLIRFVLCFLLLLVPTTLMGGTLPVLGKLLLRNWRGLGVRAGLLYGTNTLGAVLGVAGGGFLLLPALGLRGATLVAIGLNVLVAAAAILTSRRFPFSPPAPETAPAGGVLHPDDASRRRLRRAVLIVYGASGFAALSYEVAWTKTLSMILGTTTYAFTSMLTTFLLGLALGAFLFGKLADRYGRPEALLLLVQAIIPLAALATVPILERLPQLFVDRFSSLAPSWTRIELYRVFLAGMTMFVPTVLMGGMFPLATRAYVEKGRTGRSLGSLYAANTVGAILGSFLAGFVLVPLLGRQHSILVATFINLAAVFVLLAALPWRRIPLSLRWAVPATLILSGIFLAVPSPWNPLNPWNPRIMAAGAYVYAQQLQEHETIEESMNDMDLLYYDEATEGTVSVWQGEYITSLRTSGKVEASSHGDMITQKMLSHLPLIYHSGNPRTAVMIGLASGISVGSLLSHDLERVDTVELIPSMIDAARLFSFYNHDCLDDPRHHIILNDGRNHLRLTDKRYDVVLSEPSNPWIAGVSALFTREFFDLTKERLNPGGVVTQWVQLYQYRESDLKTVLATFYDAYPYIHLWEGALGDILIVSSLEPLVLRQEAMEAALRGPSGEDLSTLEILPLSQILSLFITDRDGLGGLVGDWPERVTDDNLYLEFAVPRHMADPRQTLSPFFFDSVRKDPLRILEGPLASDPGFAEELKNFRRARVLTQLAHFNRPLPSTMSTPQEARRAAYRIAPREVFTRHALSHEINEEAINAYLANDMMTAAARFQEATEVGSSAERAIALNNLGTIAYTAGGFDKAREYWEQALELEPAFSKASFNLSLLAVRDGEFTRACDYLENSIRFNPSWAEAHNNLAYHLAGHGGDLERAEKAARAAVELEPSVDHRDTLGFVLLRQERWREAGNLLAGLVAEHPDAYEAILHLGMARAGQGRAGEARDAFEKVRRSAPRDDLRQRAEAEIEKLTQASE